MMLNWIYKKISRIENISRFERIWKLAQVDFKKRYYNDKFGIVWAFFNPIIRVMVFYYVFEHVINRTGLGIDNFALFLFSALIFWMAFVELIKTSMKIFRSKGYLIKNLKVNKIDLYLSNAVTSLLGLLFNITSYMLVATLFGTTFSFDNILLLPLLIITIYFIGIGLGMYLSICQIFFNDINHLIDIIILIGFWTSGVIFPSELILEKFPAIYYINPFIGIFDNLRNILLFDNPINITILTINMTIAIFIYIGGFYILNKYYQFAFEKL